MQPHKVAGGCSVMHLRPHTAPNHGADPKPTPDQVAFADRILLNKTDLVEESELAPIEARLQQIKRSPS